MQWNQFDFGQVGDLHYDLDHHFDTEPVAHLHDDDRYQLHYKCTYPGHHYDYDSPEQSCGTADPGA